jgi:hypothetical protein
MCILHREMPLQPRLHKRGRHGHRKKVVELSLGVKKEQHVPDLVGIPDNGKQRRAIAELEFADEKALGSYWVDARHGEGEGKRSPGSGKVP